MNSTVQASTQTWVEVKHDGSFPSLFLEIRLAEAQAHLDCIRSQKKNSSASDRREEKTIPIIAKGQDAFFYRIDGEDVASEDEASSRLLKPLLESLDE